MKTLTSITIIIGCALAATFAMSQGALQTGIQTTQNTTATISGRVAKAGGEPLKKATVTLRPSNGGGGQGAPGSVIAVGGQLGGAQIGAGGQGGAQGAQGGQGLPGAQATPGGPAGGPAGGGRGGLRSAATGDDGTFAFKDIAPGQYLISATHDGFVSQDYGQRATTGTGTTLTVSAGQRLTTIDFSLQPAGTIAGKIIDEDGQPVVGIQVQASSYQYVQGQRALTQSRQTQTNDLGEYRLYWLAPGEYIISAVPNSFGGPPGDQGGGPRGQRGGGPGAQVSAATDEKSFAASYYPSGVDPLRASTIEMPPAAEIRGVDFMLWQVTTAKVSGKIVSPVALPAQNAQQQGGRGGGPGGRGEQGGRGGGPGGGPGGIQVVLVSATNAGGGGRGGRGGAPGGGRGGGGGGNPPAGRGNVNADGAFEIANVVPGSYTLAAILRQNDAQYSATTRLDVGEAGARDITLRLRPGIDLKGQIYIEGQQTVPQNFKMQQVRIQLNPAIDIPLGNGDVTVKEDGSFTMTNVAAMSYRVNAQLPGGAYLVAGRFGSADALNGPVEVGEQDAQLQLQIGFSPGRVQGSVTDRTSQPFPAATIALVPSARGRLDLYKSITSDQNGKFTFSNVAPGSYKLFAWDEVQQGAYQDPAFLDRYEDRGKLVRIENSGSASEEITVIAAGR